MPSPVRAFAFGPLLAGLMLAAATRTIHAQTLDTVVGQSVAAVARLASQAERPAHRFDITLDAAVQRALERNLDIAVRRIHPLVQDKQVVAANAAFLPLASSGFNFDQALASQVDGKKIATTTTMAAKYLLEIHIDLLVVTAWCSRSDGESPRPTISRSSSPSSAASSSTRQTRGRPATAPVCSSPAADESGSRCRAAVCSSNVTERTDPLRSPCLPRRGMLAWAR